jgi:hypothetical protein
MIQTSTVSCELYYVAVKGVVACSRSVFVALSKQFTSATALHLTFRVPATHLRLYTSYAQTYAVVQTLALSTEQRRLL